MTVWQMDLAGKAIVRLVFQAVCLALFVADITLAVQKPIPPHRPYSSDLYWVNSSRTSLGAICPEQEQEQSFATGRIERKKTTETQRHREE